MDNESLVWASEWMRRRLAASETNADTRFTLASTKRKKRMQLADWKNGASKARKHIASMEFEWSLSQYVNDDHDTSDQLGSTLQSTNVRCSDWWKPRSTSYCRHDRSWKTGKATAEMEWNALGLSPVTMNTHTHTRMKFLGVNGQRKQRTSAHALTMHTHLTRTTSENLGRLSSHCLSLSCSLRCEQQQCEFDEERDQCSYFISCCQSHGKTRHRRPFF